MKPILRPLITLITTTLLLSACALFQAGKDDRYPASHLLSLTQSVETTPGPELQQQAEQGLERILSALPLDENTKAVFKAADKPSGLILEAGDLEMSHLRVGQDQAGVGAAMAHRLGAVRAVVIVDGDFETSAASNAFIIASGNVSISHSTGNVVVAGGNIEMSGDGAMGPGSLIITQGHAEISHANQSVVYAEGGVSISFARGVESFNTPQREVSHGHVNNRKIDNLFGPAQ